MSVSRAVIMGEKRKKRGEKKRVEKRRDSV
jgi:hypothetical protein